MRRKATAMRMCEQKYVKRDFSKSEVDSERMRKKTSLAMQPTYSESELSTYIYIYIYIYYGILLNPVSLVGNLSWYKEKLSNCVGVGCTTYINMATTPWSQ